MVRGFLPFLLSERSKNETENSWENQSENERTNELPENEDQSSVFEDGSGEQKQLVINTDNEETLSREAQIEDEDRITLSWSGVSVQSFVKSAKKNQVPPKNILTEVAGIVKPGNLMALMGASGAGKTTLLNILNIRNRTSLIVSGKVMINGHIVDQKQMSDNSVFVQQADIFVGTLTVKEHLTFHAKLRMKHSSAEEIEKRVEDVMAQMGLEKCENVLIGVVEKIKGISGGEAKRLAFATEILSKPTLIFADEPTSGLDTFMARSLVKLLKRYADVGRTILCTIHQPSSEIFELFDHICIMAEGKCAFIGQASKCLETFERAGFPCPEVYNPADHYVFVLAVIPGEEDACRTKVAQITEEYQKSPEHEELTTEIKELMANPQSGAFKTKKRKTTCGVWVKHMSVQFNQILFRQLKTTLRDPMAFFVRLAMGALIAIIVGLTWLKVDLKDSTSRQNVPGCLYYLSTLVALSSTMLLVVVIPNEMPVITRDYLSGVYSIPVYYSSLAFFYSIEVLISTTLNFHIIYWTVFTGTLVNEVEAYPMVYLTMVLVALVSVGVGMLISSIASSFTMALSVSNPLSTLFMLYSGFLILDKEIPPYFRMFQYASSWYYSLAINMNLIYKGVNSSCSFPKLNERTLIKIEDEMVKEEGSRDAEKLKDLVAELCNPEVECDNYLSGADVLRHYEMEGKDTDLFRLAMVLLILGYHLIGFTVLTVKMWFKRK